MFSTVPAIHIAGMPLTLRNDNNPAPACAYATSPCARCGAYAVSFCSALGGEEFAQLNAMATSRSLNARQQVIQEGDRATSMINVVSGALKLYRTLPDGRVQIIGFLGPGDFIGTPYSLQGAYSVSAEALTASRICSFPRRAFQELMTNSPALERRLFNMTSNEVLAAQNHLVLLGRKTARERVASFLVSMMGRTPAAAQERLLSLPMTRQEIADYLGITMETVSRTLSAFRSEGLIDLKSATQLKVCLPALLEAVATGAAQ